MYKMNEIINKFLLAGDKFIPEMHLRQPIFTYSACGPFTKNKERMQKYIETVDLRYINITWSTKMLKIYLEEQYVMEYYPIKYLILLKIKNVIDINMELLQWFIHFLLKCLQVVLLHVYGQRP